jgi:HSP20 family molecular chaperone IbpA
MNNQKIILAIGFLLLSIIGYQGYLLYQKDSPKDPNVIEKKIVKKDAPEIHINIDKSDNTKTVRATVDTTTTPSTTQLSDTERREQDKEKIEKSIQEVFKSIFASKEVQEGISQFKQQAQTGMQELQKELENLPSKIDEMQNELKDDPFFSQILGQLKGFGGKQLEDKGDHYFLKMPIPGGKESKVNIQTKENYLTIAISAKDQHKSTSNNATIIQSTQQNSTEILLIPKDALIEKLQTSYDQGILTISIPKVKGSTSL